MMLIVDSGSTKADWMIVGPEGSQLVNTVGFNPVFHSSELIATEVNNSFSDLIDKSSVEEIFYYGAGCWDAKRKEVVRVALNSVFPRAVVDVEHDLLGAARASCGRDPGIACIIGTGSNSCLFDGVRVTDNVTNLGYLLGDEGSGSYLGKRIIRAYFYREMPADLQAEFEEFIPGGKSEILDRVYGKETPNAYIASFTRFLSQFKGHPFSDHLLYESFAEFIDRHVRKYDGHLRLPVHFIGSIAYLFQDVLRTVLAARAMRAGRFIQKPIEQLVLFHQQTP